MEKEYRVRIDRVIDYIENNLHKRILLAELAEVSHFSAFHFHRIFTGIVGETVNDYIIRRRLEKAANRLIFKKELSITQVALESGFSSSANFSKAVKNYFGFSPSEMRNPEKVKDSKIGKILSKYGKDFHPAGLYPDRITSEVIKQQKSEGVDMKVEVRELESRRVCTLPSERGYLPESIYAAWDRLIDWAVCHGIAEENQERFALAFDNPTLTPVEKCRYTAAVVVGSDVSVKAPFALSEIPGGKYAVLYFKGKPEETLEAQLGLYSDWLPESGFEPDDFPMMEHYLNDARKDGYVEMEIHVKLKAL